MCVLDVETRVSASARALLATGDRPTVARSVLLEVTAASVLRFEAGTKVGGFSIETALAEDVGEPEVLKVVDAALTQVARAGGVSVSHNGLAHDLPVCARRAMHHWMFDAAGILGAWGGTRTRHVDTMLAFGSGDGRGPSLRDLAAGLGFDAAVPSRSPLSTVHPLREKVEVDVVATAVCSLYLGAADRQSGAWLADAWSSLSSFLLTPPVRVAHLMPIARIGFGLADERGRRDHSG